MRARELGIEVGTGVPGPGNAITDVEGVRVGHTTLIQGDGSLEVGRGPVRTGVTVILPHDRDVWKESLFAGCHRLNGNGELTGLEWVRESGMLTSAVALTSTHSVGVVHDALIAHQVAAGGGEQIFWSLPVVGETWDGLLNDINGFHVRPEHVSQALDGASGGEVPVPRLPRRPVPEGAGSIIVVVATDAPLLPNQCDRLAQRAGLGIARTGGLGEHTSGDLFLAFATGNRGLSSGDYEDEEALTQPLRMLSNSYIGPLFEAVVEATEEAILNAMLQSPTMVGRDGVTAHGLDGTRLVEVMERYGRGPRRTEWAPRAPIAAEAPVSPERVSRRRGGRGWRR
jgi:D-aminopeptidase